MPDPGLTPRWRCRIGRHAWVTIPLDLIRAGKVAGSKRPPLWYVGRRGVERCWYCEEVRRV